MAPKEASLLLNWGTAKALATDLWAFAKDPTPAPAQLNWGTTLLFALAVLLVIDLSFAFATIALESGLADIGFDLPDHGEPEIGPGWEFALAILLAPTIEEALFRGWLSGTKAALRFAAIGWAVAFVIIAFALFARELMLGSVSILLLGALFAASLYWAAYRQIHTERPAWFRHHYKWLVWGSTLAFGLMHIGNYVNFDEPIDFIVLLSQTSGGLILAYTRTRLGLMAAMSQHAIFNAVFTYLV